MPASLTPTVNDHCPSTTVVVFPPGASSVCPLESTSVTVAPVSPVPLMVKPATFSMASTILSVATVLITGAVGTSESITTERVTAVLTLPAASVAVMLIVDVASAGMSPSP